MAGIPDGCWREFGHEAGMIDLLECFSSAVICGVLRINAVKKLQNLSPLLSGAEEEPKKNRT